MNKFCKSKVLVIAWDKERERELHEKYDELTVSVQGLNETFSKKVQMIYKQYRWYLPWVEYFVGIRGNYGCLDCFLFECVPFHGRSKMVIEVTCWEWERERNWIWMYCQPHGHLRQNEWGRERARERGLTSVKEIEWARENKREGENKRDRMREIKKWERTREREEMSERDQAKENERERGRVSRWEWERTWES